jgi:two-component system, cell cycle sensor histidine kinase and response regulator CckA
MRRIVLLMLVLGPFLGSAEVLPEILLVNSYHQGYRWSDDIMRGVAEALHEAGITARIQVEFLDSKRHPQVMRDPALRAFMDAKYHTTRFSLIISTDDNATWFMQRERDAMFPGVPLVFCGVNDLQPERLTGVTGITGVNESADVGETLDWMLRLHPRASRVLVVTDGTETGQGVSRAVARWRIAAPQRIALDLLDHATTAELTDALDRAGDGTLVLYTFFFEDRDGRTFDYDQSAALVRSHAHVPVYTTWEFNQGFGMVGGKQTGGNGQGRAAGELAVRILTGTPVDSLPVHMVSPNRWVFEYEAMKRFGIRAADLPPGSSIVGEPDTAYYRYRGVIWATAAVLALLVGIIAMLISNIRQRRHAVLALRRSEESLETTLDSIADAVIATDEVGRVTRLNPVAEGLTGWRQAEAVGTPLDRIFSMIDEQARSVCESPVSRVVRGETVVGTGVRTLLLDRRGGERPIAHSTAPIRDRQGSIVGVVLVFRDQTAERQASQRLQDSEMRLRQHEKLGAIGQLAGGIAHDFNNQLTGILGFAELLSTRVRDPTLLRPLDHIMQAAQRSADLTRQLLSFARKGKVLTVTVRMHEVIQQVVDLLAHSIDKRIHIVTDLQAAPDTVLGDPGQLQNALLNLALNARDAMPNGGELRFSSRIIEKPPKEEGSGPRGSCLQIDVCDTGIGMDAETRRHIFEPFFTTKEAGKGTGLGLASVYGAVRSHGGTVRVASEPGHGSRFSVLLPLLTDVIPESRQAAPAGRHDGASILVVDDDDAVRLLLVELLGGLGYHVTACVDGAEAVERFRSGWRDIDLVILDLVMPRMGGGEVFTAMKAIDPSLRVLLISGYSSQGAAQAILEEGACGFVAKPFHAADLGRQIEEALHHPV